MRLPDCLPSPHPDDRSIDALADAVVRIWNYSALVAVDAIGKLVLDAVFDGDADLLRQPGPKAQSLGLLADALSERGMKITVGRLRKIVHQHLVLRELVGSTDTAVVRHLAPSHLDEVASLPTEKRLPLLLEAEASGMSVRDLRARVRKMKHGTSRARRRRARRRLSVPTDELQVEGALAVIEEAEERARSAASELPRGPWSDHELRLRVTAAAVRLREVGERLQDKLNGDA